jgi:CubicO group peptidase (beta-lactamase class C family)
MPVDAEPGAGDEGPAGGPPTITDLPGRLSASDARLGEHYPPGGPGAAVLLVVGGQPVLRKGYGLAEVEAGVPITTATPFDLASVAKQLTALAVVVLASRGQLTLHDDVSLYLAELSRLDVAEGRALRLGDLLHHTSGLPDYLDTLKPWDYARFTNDRLVAWAARQRLLWPPGTRGFFLSDGGSTYCNTNYALLASVVERVSGRPFPDFLRDEIFHPLGMTASLCDPFNVSAPGRAQRYDERGRRVRRPRCIPTYGDGNVYSTADDFLRLDAQLAAPTLVGGEWIQRCFAAGTLDDGRPTNYGLGWKVGCYRGRQVAWHGGSWDGTSTYFSRWLEDRVSVVVFSNGQVVRATRVGEEVEAILLGDAQ